MTTIKIEAETSLLKAEAPKQGNYYISDEGALYHLAVIVSKAVLVNVKGGYLATPVPLTASPCSKACAASTWRRRSSTAPRKTCWCA